jgi:DNA-binding XRE family transcriptional regulator
MKKKKTDLIPSDEVFKEIFGDFPQWAVHLRGYRNREGLTQKQLAEALGIHQPIISAIENGKRTMGKKMAKKLANFFNADYRSFL